MKNRKCKIVIIGGGQLGSACLGIARTRVSDCEVKLMARAELDLTWSEGDIQDALILEGDVPDVVINCAAYNDVDGAESKRGIARDVNHYGVRKLAQFCKGRAGKTLLIHFSTDYVFDGVSPGPDGYEEHVKLTNPVNVYGRSKLAGDYAMSKLLSSHQTSFGSYSLPYYILRTSSLWSDPIGPHKSFASTVIQRLRAGETMKVRANQFMKPTHVLDLAEAVMVLINMYERLNEVKFGLYNFACSGATSWHGFATAIGEKAFKMNMAQLIEPVSEYDTAAVRPKDTRLDCSRWVQATGLTPRHWMATMEHVGRFVMENAGVQTD